MNRFPYKKYATFNTSCVIKGVQPRRMSGMTDDGLGFFGRLSFELRSIIYRYYFANAIVRRLSYPATPQHPYTTPRPITRTIRWRKDYWRDLLLTSSVIYQEALPFERSTNYHLSLGYVELKTLPPLFLRRKTTWLAIDGANTRDHTKLPLHEYPMLKRLSLRDFNPGLCALSPFNAGFSRVDNLFQGKYDDILLQIARRTMNNNTGFPSSVEKPELIPKDIIVDLHWFTYLPPPGFSDTVAHNVRKPGERKVVSDYQQEKDHGLLTDRQDLRFLWRDGIWTLVEKQAVGFSLNVRVLEDGTFRFS
jgi:hypothetical protein